MMTTTTTTSEAAGGLTARDAYEAGRYVTRHYGTEGARARMAVYWGAHWPSYWLGRDKLARTGEP